MPNPFELDCVSERKWKEEARRSNPAAWTQEEWQEYRATLGKPPSFSEGVLSPILEAIGCFIAGLVLILFWGGIYYVFTWIILTTPTERHVIHGFIGLVVFILIARRFFSR